MRGGKIVLLIVGMLFVLAGVGTGAAATVTGWMHLVHRDDAGFVNTPRFALETDGYALTAEHLELVATPGDWTGWTDRIDLRLRVTPGQGGESVFVGIAPRAEVDRYLGDVAHDELAASGSGEVRSSQQPGDAVPGAPGNETFWVASTEGAEPLTLEWTATAGDWSIVVMNSDATPGIIVDADAGVQTGVLGPIALGLLLTALVLIGGGAAMIIAAVPDEHRAVQGSLPAPSGPRRAGAHPLTLVGHLDPEVSRWQWLVKWLLLIPHIIVLALLWAAFVVLTFVAGVAILFTGRYPRGIFGFNVGVLRWTWRITFYGYGVLGTDRYPPFTLDDVVDYPAHLDIVYPVRLSRGLVLVKSWLLALPHLLIVAVFTGGAATWTYQVTPDESWQFSLGGGLIGLLALVAGIALLFTARYPAGLFDLLLGLNRWVYRVVAYVALMTDDYPPFRLDTGGDEPIPPPPPPRPASGSTVHGPRPTSV